MSTIAIVVGVMLLVVAVIYGLGWLAEAVIDYFLGED